MHHMQDIILTVGALFFIAGLLPSILSDSKPAAITSLVNGSVLAIFSITYATLSLWFTAATTAATAVCWWILAVQKHRSNRNRK